MVTIRGTLSLEDCIVDATAEPESLQAAGDKWGFDGAGRFAHSGMLRSALWIREDLEQSGLLLSQASTGSNGGGGITNVVVVGHSLGAGAAVVLAWLLRPAFPSLKCFAYG